MPALNTSSTVTYGLDAGRKRLVLEEDDSAGLVKTGGVSFVRVFPSSAGARVTAVMGGAQKVGTGISIKITEYVSFSDSVTSGLRYYPVGAVAIQDKKFFRASPVVVYDAQANSLLLDVKAFGICKVSYTSTYDRYRVTHGDSPCRAALTQSTGGDAPTDGTVTYDPVFLVAEADEWDTGSITVSGPPCDGQEGFNSTSDTNRYEPIGLKVEEDEEYKIMQHPQYFNANRTPRGFTLTPQQVFVGGVVSLQYVGGRVRVYPKVAVTLVGVNCAVGSSIFGEGEKAVLQALTFSGSSSVGLDYPPFGSVSLSGKSRAVDLFNNEIDVEFRGPGDYVNEVEWTSANTYRITQGSRQVRKDEIVVVTALGNNTVPCFTFCEVRYVAQYYLYDVLLNFDDRRGWYSPGMVLAYTSDNERGSLDLQPPARGGVV